jgi:lipopolysaccharide export system protein LptA
LVATSDRLDVVALEREDARPSASSALALETIEATGDVTIKQAGRVSTAAKALILPKEQKVVLEGDAVVDDDRGRVSGHRITLLQGQRRALVEGAGSGDGRARITLPAMP